MSPTDRRQAVQHLEACFETSERQTCRVVGQARSTQRYEAQVRSDEPALLKRMHERVRVHPRYGYRRIWAVLRGERWRVNRKRMGRLWKQEGFKVPQKQHKKRRLGSSEQGIVRHRPQHKNHVWAWDFVHDRDHVEFIGRQRSVGGKER